MRWEGKGGEERGEEWRGGEVRRTERRGHFKVCLLETLPVDPD